MGKGNKERELTVLEADLGVVPVGAGDSFHFPEEELPPQQSSLISHLLYMFPWSAEITATTRVSTGEIPSTIKLLNTKEN